MFFTRKRTTPCMGTPQPANRTLELTASERTTLLEVAGWAIDEGLRGRDPSMTDLANYAPALNAPTATFVTLYGATYRDPRFAPVTVAERVRLEIQISVLTPPEPMSITSEADLLRQLRPGIDGLVLTERGRHGTFLPAVWEMVDGPHEFLRHLKIKAGLPPDYWSDTVRVSRYTTLSIP
jgi:uncharacterized protein